MVPFGAVKRSRPLLPYERELIELLGCSEEEYKNFVEYTTQRAKIRPAEYEYIPDIVNAPAVSILISLAIGLVTSAISYLLMPKPRDTNIEQRQLAGRTGADRFAQTSGFDSVNELARYGDPIPLIWTRWTGTTGGVVVSPKLVWSRIYSWGGQQSAKMMYVVGETGITAPNLAGVYLGNSGMNVLSSTEYAFWWNNNGRPERTNILYGSQQGPIAGDPAGTSDLFQVGLGDGAFSGAFTPSNNAQFGISNALPNATSYRPSWAVISIPAEVREPSRSALIRERRKIAGPDHPSMTGVGAGYGRRMGIAGFSRQVLSVSVGTQIYYRIGGPDIPKNSEGGDNDTPSFEDINNAIDAECSAADEILQAGETLLIGGSAWKVTGRSLPIWTPGQIQYITLQCVEILGANSIEVANEADFTNPGRVTQDRVPASSHYGTSFFPLNKVNFGLVKNTRACDVTEICFRSQVWLRFNGMCNFQTIPKPQDLDGLDRDNVSLRTGTITEYGLRSSVFTIYYRYGGATEWTRTGVRFCVRGATPTDQFNHLRIRHPNRSSLEFRLVPLPAAQVTRFAVNTPIYWLQGGASQWFSVNAPGGLIFEGRGSEVLSQDLELSPQMTQDGRGPGSFTTNSRRITAVRFERTYQAVPYEWITLSRQLFGIPTRAGQNSSAVEVLAYSANRRVTVTVRINTTSFKAPLGDIRWAQPPTCNVIRSDTSDFYGIGQQMTYTTAAGSNNFGISGDIGIVFAITAIDYNVLSTPERRGWRRFETHTQLAEVSHYGSLITRSCDNGPEHSIVAVNEQLTSFIGGGRPSYSNLCMAAVSVKSNRSFNQLDQLSVFVKSGITNSNSFPQLVQYLLLNGTNIISSALIDTASINNAHNFTMSNGLFFDGVIVDRANVRSYITNLAPFFLCNFVIANGKFSIMPAVPLNTARPGISQIFTAGNILDGSFSVDYTSLDERRDFQAMMTYRVNPENQLPITKSVLVRFSDTSQQVPVESFDMSPFCTSRQHAVLVARYFLSIRRRITHAIRFKTAPEVAGIAPGAYIKVALEQNVISSFNNGIVNNDGSVVNATPLANGSYEIIYWKAGMSEPAVGTMPFSNGFTSNTDLYGSLFSLYENTLSANTYMIEQVELDEDGLVNVVATEMPVDQILQDLSGAGMVETQD